MAFAYDYRIFDRFIKTHLHNGFGSISPGDAILAAIEQRMNVNRQFFYIADMKRLKYLFVSRGSNPVVGADPVNVDPGFMLSITHPDDLGRHQLARSQAIKISNELYRNKKGVGVISASFRVTRDGTRYFNLLYQGYLFCGKYKTNTVFIFMVLTDLTDFPHPKNRYHFYSGPDLTCFRFPDKDLLAVGNIFTNGAFRILHLIESGLNTEEIAAKLSRSPDTIETHRRNIIKKSGLPSTKDVIIDLKNKGLM